MDYDTFTTEVEKARKELKSGHVKTIPLPIDCYHDDGSLKWDIFEDIQGDYRGDSYNNTFFTMLVVIKPSDNGTCERWGLACAKL